VAVINAALKIKREPPFILKRSEAYIGVLIDDLVNKSTDEPYRMFTSRAEYRLLLRQDNADRRLMKYGYQFGLIPDSVYTRLKTKEKFIDDFITFLERTGISPEEINPCLESAGSSIVWEKEKLIQLLKRPEVGLSELLPTEYLKSDSFVHNLYGRTDEALRREVFEQVEIEVKYEGYIERQEDQIHRFQKLESLGIPEDFDFLRLKSLSTEGREKMSRVRPRSVGQASRISGVTPADVSVLMVYLV